jgi:hypothetical protein
MKEMRNQRTYVEAMDTISVEKTEFLKRSAITKPLAISALTDLKVRKMDANMRYLGVGLAKS